MDPGGRGGPQGILRGPQAQGPKAHADVRISNMSLILRSSELVGDTGRHPDRMIEHVAAMLSQALDELTRQGTTVPGIVLAHPGIIDYANDTVRYSSTLGRYDVALMDKVRDAIARRTGSGRDVPVITLENDAELAALATYERYAPAGVRNLLYLSGGEGIGAGIIADGHLFRGWLGLTGEVGHMPVEPEGLLCRCGRRGCWETRSGLEARLLDRRAQVKVEVSHLGQWASSHGAALVALESVLDTPCLGGGPSAGGHQVLPHVRPGHGHRRRSRKHRPAGLLVRRPGPAGHRLRRLTLVAGPRPHHRSGTAHHGVEPGGRRTHGHRAGGTRRARLHRQLPGDPRSGTRPRCTTTSPTAGATTPRA